MNERRQHYEPVPQIVAPIRDQCELTMVGSDKHTFMRFVGFKELLRMRDDAGNEGALMMPPPGWTPPT